MTGDPLQGDQGVAHQVGVGDREILTGVDHQAPQLGVHQREEHGYRTVRPLPQGAQGLHHGVQFSQPGVPDDLEVRTRELGAGGPGQPHRRLTGRVGQHMDLQVTVGHGQTVADRLGAATATPLIPV